MRNYPLQNSRVLRRSMLGGLAAGFAALAGARPGIGQSLASAREAALSRSNAFDTAIAYVEEFYPLWFTYYQSQYATINRLAGPNRVSPLYHIVVAINVDTLYASSFIDLSSQPVVLTIPKTEVTYSLLTLDPYGDIFESGIGAQTPGTYALTGSRFGGALPAGVTRIAMPLDFSTLIFRADKYSAAGEDQIDQAQLFRKSLKLQTLADYRVDPAGGATLIVPEILTAVPFKTTADNLIARAPLTFLKQLQTAVASSNTPPLSPYEQVLADRFDALFRDAETNAFDFSAGAQTAHDLIVDRYLTHTGPTNWIHFTNIGNWGKNVIERSSITEFIQYGNSISTAAYYHTFSDGAGRPLNGRNPLGYVMTFAKNELPEAERFWSLTAYTPDAIELVANPVNKYAVASYTPELRYWSDGSLSVYLAQQLPPDVPLANWLPVPPGAFDIMLRVYGPKGSVANNKYVPPAIRKL